MLKMDCGDGYPGSWARLCDGDSCRLSPSSLYCPPDSAYPCSSCDGQIHSQGSARVGTLNRVQLCGACGNAPAAFTCKADDASLCITCDFEIHSANPIASRHIRAPVSPLCHVPHDVVVTTNDQPNYEVVDNNNVSSKEMDEREADSWLLLDSADTIDSQVDDGFMFGEAEDDHHAPVGVVEECDSSTKFENFREDRDQRHQPYSFSEEMTESDSVVPIQSVETQPKLLQQQQHQTIYFNMEHKPSRVAFTNFPPNCRSFGLNENLVAVPYMDAQMLQRGAISDLSGYRFPKGAEIFPSASVSMQIQFGQMNRKAGVEKYREKKKSRKFEKRIRYAYRKAYAEKRPRVKGRFVKRQDSTSEAPVPLQ